MTSRRNLPITRVDFGRDGAGCGHIDSVITEIGEPQLAQQQAAVGVRVGTHAAHAPRWEVGQFGPQPAVAVEQFRGSVALHPIFEDTHMIRVLVHLAHRHLMRPPVALGAPAVDLFRTSPSLGRAQHDHRPAGAFAETILACIGLDAPDVADDRVERGGHQLVHGLWLIPLDEVRGVAITSEQVVQFLVADPGQDARIGDLVAVEVKDRQNHSVRRRI